MTPDRPMIYFFADERAAVAFCQRALERANGRFTRLDPVYTNMFAQAPWCCVTDLSVEDAHSVNGGQTWVGISRVVPPLLEQLLARGKAEMAEMMGMGGMAGGAMDAPADDPSPLSGLAGLPGLASGDPSALLRAMRQRKRDRERAASGLTGKYAPDAPPPASREFKELWNRRMGW